ncbi:dodecin [Aquisediminimonas sediminicola]|uniref:dodecin n=1 Tax=Alteraquisediminimonas sediminicola TaxID=2676787 RepID=UPI001C8D9A8F|nr:dodecin [Aquisediminimonas sediminicola]
MSNHVYKVVEIVGTSSKSIEDAIQKGISRAGSSLRHIGWFEVVGTRGHVEDDHVVHYQVTMKVGFRMESDG